MDPSELDARIRLGAFAYLDDLKARCGPDLPWSALTSGFEFQGVRVPLLGPQGIFKPKILPLPVPISITTAPVKPGETPPYDDQPSPDGFLLYRYRGTDPEHHENVGLRKAMDRQIPLIYFEGIQTGWYSAQYPVYVIADDPRSLSVKVAADQVVTFGQQADRVGERLVEARRAYVTQLVRRRLHQDRFHHNVLAAYRVSCAICSLRRRELLEAAHIIPDRDFRGVPEISNGLALCKLHHGAFDSHLVGIRPDLVVEVRPDVRKEEDGPMLIHGLQECHGRSLRVIPKDDAMRPRKEFLEERYQVFRRAG